MNITVAQIGQTDRTIVAMAGATVGDVLSALGINVTGKTIQVGASPATLGTSLRDGDVVALTPKVSGGVA